MNEKYKLLIEINEIFTNVLPKYKIALQTPSEPQLKLCFPKLSQPIKIGFNDFNVLEKCSNPNLIRSMFVVCEF